MTTELIEADIITRFICPQEDCQTPNEVEGDARGNTIECRFCDCEVVINCALEHG